MATFDGNGYRVSNIRDLAPGKAFTVREPEGEYSTIRHPDGTVETILFRNDGTTVGPVQTYQSVVEIQRDHIRKIQNEIVKGA